MSENKQNAVTDDQADLLGRTISKLLRSWDEDLGFTLNVASTRRGDDTRPVFIGDIDPPDAVALMESAIEILQSGDPERLKYAPREN